MKNGYRALQNMLAIFDNTLTRVDGFPSTDDASSALSVFRYAKADGGRVVTIWKGASKPGENNSFESVNFTFPGSFFTIPVWVDLRTGAISGIPADRWSRNPEGTSFNDIPIYDSPILIAEKSAVLPPKAVFKNLHFTDSELTENAISGDRADPDADGFDNFFEYVLHMDPRKQDAPTIGVSVSPENFKVIFERGAGADGLYEIEVSTTLGVWGPPPATMSASSITVDGGAYDRVTLTGLTEEPSPSKFFIRFRLPK